MFQYLRSGSQGDTPFAGCSPARRKLMELSSATNGDDKKLSSKKRKVDVKKKKKNDDSGSCGSEKSSLSNRIKEMTGSPSLVGAQNMSLPQAIHANNQQVLAMNSLYNKNIDQTASTHLQSTSFFNAAAASRASNNPVMNNSSNNNNNRAEQGLDSQSSGFYNTKLGRYVL